jgi:hypothetical protein
MLQAFVPKTAVAYIGLRVPLRVWSLDGKTLGDLLAGHDWSIIDDGVAAPHVLIEQPWGHSRAYADEYIIRDVEGTVNVLSPLHFQQLGLKAIDIVLKTK